MNWYLHVIKNYVTFAGRARRKEYWMFFLFNVIFTGVAAAIDNVLGTNFKMEQMGMEVALPYGYVYLVYMLFVLLPSISVLVRRLHDIGKSGWMFWVALIPLAGGIWLLVLMVTEGNRGANAYGDDPKAI